MKLVEPTSPILTRVFVIEIKLSTILIGVALWAVAYIISERRKARQEREHRAWFKADQAKHKKEMEELYAEQRRERDARLADSDAVTDDAKLALIEMREMLFEQTKDNGT